MDDTIILLSGKRDTGLSLENFIDVLSSSCINVLFSSICGILLYG